MSPHSTFVDSKLCPNSQTLIDNCLVVTLRKCEVYGCQSVARYANSVQWSSDVSERAFSPEPPASVLSPSPCFSYSTSEGETLKNDTQNGWSLFQSFVKENSNCFWNPSLIASINSIEFRGFILPCSILFSGSEYDLEVIRSSWARMTLKPPQGYAVESLGDLGSLEMTSVNQTHFTPLSEALCTCIHSLNTQGYTAFAHTIIESLRQNYPHLTPPSLDVIKKALKALQKEGKLRYISSRGYVVLPPDNYGQIANGGNSRTAKNNATLMTNEEAIGKLHGTPTEEQLTFRSFGVQVDSSKLHSSPTSSGVTSQYAIDFDNVNGDTSLSHDYASLKRSASLRIYNEKAKVGDEKNNSFVRSKSLKLHRDKHPKSFSNAPVSPKAEKKPSMFRQLMTRWNISSTNRRNCSSSSTPPPENRKVEKESRGTQTLEKVKPNVQKKAAKSETRNYPKTIAKSYATTTGVYSKPCYCLTCSCCNTIVDKKMHGLSVYADYCVNESGRYLCLPTIDPNCEHCLASLNSKVTCNECLTGERNATLRSINGKAVTPTSSPNTIIRPKTPLKLNNNKAIRNDKTKPISMQTNALREENHNSSNSLSNATTEAKECVNNENSVIAFIDSGSENGNTYSANNPSDAVKKMENESLRFENRKHTDLKDDNNCKLLSANSVNLKIEIGSKTSATTASPSSESPAGRNASNDTTAGSQLGHQLIGKCAFVEPKYSASHKQESPITSTKQSTVMSTRVTTTMTVPNAVVTNANHNFTINTITKTTTTTSDEIEPKYYETKRVEPKKAITIDDCTCKQTNYAKEAINADLNRAIDDRISISNIREKVAKAKAAFFNVNNASQQLAK